MNLSSQSDDSHIDLETLMLIPSPLHACWRDHRSSPEGREGREDVLPPSKSTGRKRVRGNASREREGAGWPWCSGGSSPQRWSELRSRWPAWRWTGTVPLTDGEKQKFERVHYRCLRWKPPSSRGPQLNRKNWAHTAAGLRNGVSLYTFKTMPITPHPQSSVILCERRCHRGTAGTNFPASNGFPPIFACPVTHIWSCTLIPAPAVTVTANGGTYQPVRGQWAGFQESQQRGRRLSRKCWQSPCALQTEDSTTSHPMIREVCRAWTALGDLYRYRYISLLGILWLLFNLSFQYGKMSNMYKRKGVIIINSHVPNICLKKLSTHR